MKEKIKNRVLKEANHVLNTKDTIRETADKFNISKSTVHNDLSTRLKDIDENLSKSIEEIFESHDRLKHLRGGEVTKAKYKKG